MKSSGGGTSPVEVDCLRCCCASMKDPFLVASKDGFSAAASTCKGCWFCSSGADVDDSVDDALATGRDFDTADGEPTLIGALRFTTGGGMVSCSGVVVVVAP